MKLPEGEQGRDQQTGLGGTCAAGFATGGGVWASMQQGSREGCNGSVQGWTGARLHAWSTPMLS
jgi:hypothetical protein